MRVPVDDLKDIMSYNGEAEFYYANDHAWLGPDYKGKWDLIFDSDPDNVIKLNGVDDVLNYRYNGHLLIDNLKDYTLS